MIKMCKAVNYGAEINKQITEAKEYYNKLKSKEKIFNDMQQDLLHKIENIDKFNLYEGWELCKSLQKLRKSRRETKNELDTMERLIRQIGSFNINADLIEKRDNFLEQVKEEKRYHQRQLDMTGDILNEVNDIVNNANNFEISSFEKIYEAYESIPKIKGSNVKIRYTSIKNRSNIINNKKPAYNKYVINEKEKYIEFIDRKKGNVQC
jgi:hypothetical protein